MRFSNRILSQLFSDRAPERRAAQQRRSTFAPRLETLEKRELLALSTTSADFAALADSFVREDGAETAIWVTSLADTTSASDGKITLREALDYAGTQIDGRTLSSTIRFELGGTIKLSKTLTIGKDVSIDASDVSEVVVDRQGKGQILLAYNGTASDARQITLTGLTLKGGAAPTNATTYSGAGVYLGAYCNLTAIDCAIVDCVSPGGFGAGIYVKGGSLTLIDSLVANNASKTGASLSGGGVFVDSGSIVATRTTFRDNVASDGGDVYIKSGSATIDGSRFVDSTAASGSGGAIYNFAGSLSIKNASFLGASATAFGGALYDASGDDASTQIVDSRFVETTATNGGALYLYGAAATLDDCEFSACAATEDGGAIFSASNVELQLDGGTFVANEAGRDGGAIFNDGFLALDAAEFSENAAQDRGGALFSSGYFEIRDSVFDGATANEGGAIYVEKADDGGAFATSSSWIFRSTATGATATLGGALYNDGLLSVVDSTFSANAASSGGGAAYNGGTLYVSDTEIFENAAQNVGGGVLNEFGATFTAEKTSIRDNVAQTQNGGGIANFGSATLDATTVRGNSALGDEGFGGGIFNAGTFTVRYSTISANEAQNGGGVSNALGGTASFAYSTFAENVALENGGAAYCVGETKFTSSNLVRNVAATAETALYYLNPGSETSPSFDSKTTFSDNVAASSVVSVVSNVAVVLSDALTGAVVDGVIEFGDFAVGSANGATRTFALFNSGASDLSFSNFKTFFSGLDAKSAWTLSAKRADGTTIALNASSTFKLASGETIFLTLSAASQNVGAKSVEFRWTTKKIGANGQPIASSASTVRVAADAQFEQKTAAQISTSGDATLSIDESGEFSVAFRSKPTSNVVVYLRTADGVALSSDVLVFTPQNYSTAQKVQISLSAEALNSLETLQTGQISVTATTASSDLVWRGKTLPALEFAIDANSAANVQAESATVDVVTTTSSTAPNVVRLAATSQNVPIASWRVNWGDGSPLSVLNELGTSANFAHYYEKSGRFEITAELIDETGRGTGVWVEIGVATIAVDAVASAALFEDLAQESEIGDENPLETETLDALSAALLAENEKNRK